jgi:tRNA pseudouridine13 synthase
VRCLVFKHRPLRQALPRPVPPAAEVALGLRSYLTDTPGIGGKLRVEAEDFVVVESGEGPAPYDAGPYAAARIRLKNWETNRFAAQAARVLGIMRDHVAFAGMKDKRAVTEQWFTFKAPVSALASLGSLADVTVLEAYATRKAHFPGAHTGNGFVLRVRESTRDRETVARTALTIQREGGVPNFFGPQRFGGGFRPVTHLIGRAIVENELEEAVRLFVGNPTASEHEEAQKARRLYDETRDPGATLEVFPERLDPERDVLKRLAKRPADWRYALQALPHNLLQLFVHAHQSWIYNLVLSARVEAGLGLSTAHVGDLVMGVDEDGTKVHRVVAENREKVQREVAKGRATLTAPLVGTTSPLAMGIPGEVEQDVLAAEGIEPGLFRCRELPELASQGRRRGILQPVRGLAVAWAEDEPVFSFSLGKGSYATVVLREFMKAPLSDY